LHVQDTPPAVRIRLRVAPTARASATEARERAKSPRRERASVARRETRARVARRGRVSRSARRRDSPSAARKKAKEEKRPFIIKRVRLSVRGLRLVDAPRTFL